MSKEEEMQKLAIQYQILEANIRVIEERRQILIRHIEDLQRTKISIEELEHTKTGDAFIPLGNGNFLPGNISDVNNVIVGVGGGVAIKKNRKEAIEILEKRISDMNKIFSELSLEGEKLFAQTSEIQNKVNELQK